MPKKTPFLTFKKHIYFIYNYYKQYKKNQCVKTIPRSLSNIFIPQHPNKLQTLNFSVFL